MNSGKHEKRVKKELEKLKDAIMHQETMKEVETKLNGNVLSIE